jgi:predicted Zn-dependent protease
MRSVILLTLAMVFAATSAQSQNLPGFLRGILQPGQGNAPQPPANNAAPAQPAAAPVGRPSIFGDTSLEEEVAMGQQLAGRLLGAAPLVRDDRIQAYVNRVGRWVAAQADRPELRWHFGVIESADVNAFAMPGGFVFITKGLFDRLETESELAGVLGHEVAHVVAGHHLKLYKQSQTVGVVSGVLSQLVARRDQTGLGRNLLGNGAEALARGLDKDSEHEADRMGTVYAARAGYEPYGLLSVLGKLARINPGDGGIALLFKTHPAPQDRLSRLGDDLGLSLEPYADGRSNAERFTSITAPRR